MIGARLHDHGNFDAVPRGLAKDPDVLQLTGLIKIADILLDHIIRVRLANGGAHLGKNFLPAHRFGTGVLHINRTNDRATLRQERRQSEFDREKRERRGRRPSDGSSVGNVS